MKARAAIAIALVGAAGGAGAAAGPADTPDAVVRRMLHVEHYRLARADLNGDGRRELIVYLDGPGECGSGGCDLAVLSPGPSGWREVMDASVSRLPVAMLPATSHGWHDLTVFVAGGGILPGYTARLRFDGRRYPGNPTVPPAARYRGAAGRVLLARD